MYNTVGSIVVVMRLSRGEFRADKMSYPRNPESKITRTKSNRVLDIRWKFGLGLFTVWYTISAAISHTVKFT